MEGLTGFIKFDTQGYRSFFHLAVLELTPEGLVPVSTWNPMVGSNITRPLPPPETPNYLDENLVNRTLIVSSKLVDLANIGVPVQLNKLIFLWTWNGTE